MNLLIDIGNTACKVAFAQEHELTICKVFRYGGEDIAQFVEKTIKKELPHEKAHIAVLSNVRADDPHLEEVIKHYCDALYVLNSDLVEKLHFPVLDNMPEGMGADRIAAILASHNLFPDKDLMVFDFGTATTVEFINGRKVAPDGTIQKPQYLGGNISLGLNTRYRALSHFTERIPLLSPTDYLKENDIKDISSVGYDLPTALAAGNILGIIFEIEGYMALHPERVVILTGGDAIYFAQRLKSSIFVFNNLVLMGLALIANYYTNADE